MTLSGVSGKTVAVVDYGMGNLRSVSQAVHAAAAGSSFRVIVTSDPDEVRLAGRIVLPGQGAMPDCMRELRESGLMESVLEAAATKPLFGVCVGMQMLLEHSQEGHKAGNGAGTAGLGLFPGDVVRFSLAGQLQADGSRYKVPQMGWNQVHQLQAHPLWAGVPDQSYFYFVHSYYAVPVNPAHALAETHYGAPFCSAAGRDNLFATQFHPEKSASAGLQLYKNFVHWTP